VTVLLCKQSRGLTQAKLVMIRLLLLFRPVIQAILLLRVPA